MIGPHIVESHMKRLINGAGKQINFNTGLLTLCLAILGFAAKALVVKFDEGNTRLIELNTEVKNLNDQMKSFVMKETFRDKTDNLENRVERLEQRSVRMGR